MKKNNMINEVEIQKLKEDYPEFFKTTPPEIIEFILSDKTSEKITDICVKNGVNDEKQIEGIAYRITLVLLKRLPRENLAMTIELGLKLPPDIAKKVANEANQFIFPAMAQWKSGEVTQPKSESPKEELIPASADSASVATSAKEAALAAKEEKPKRPPSKDVYREPIE